MTVLVEKKMLRVINSIRDFHNRRHSRVALSKRNFSNQNWTYCFSFNENSELSKRKSACLHFRVILERRRKLFANEKQF